MGVVIYFAKCHTPAMWADTLFIVFISVCTALLGEGLTWLLVYRTEKYQKLKAEVERQCKRLEKKKEAHGDSVDRQQKKKIEREEERLKKQQQRSFFSQNEINVCHWFCFYIIIVNV